MAVEGAPEGLILAAEEQTAGKGRLGREFHSPAGSGVYFSLLLRPGNAEQHSDYTAQRTDNTAPRFSEGTLYPGDALLITSAAAVATALAIEEVFGVRTDIKWVNDLYYEGKKVAGILTETVIKGNCGVISYAILGIGINVTKPESGFPDDLKDTAGALTDSTAIQGDERCRLIALTLDNFLLFYRNLAARGFLDEYRARSILPGHDIMVKTERGATPAFAVAIDDDCGLIVRYPDGTIVTLNTGEVSIIVPTEL